VEGFLTYRRYMKYSVVLNNMRYDFEANSMEHSVNDLAFFDKDGNTIARVRNFDFWMVAEDQPKEEEVKVEKQPKAKKKSA
jgi:hypothetical protein